MYRLLGLLLISLAAAGCGTSPSKPTVYSSERISIVVRGSGSDVILVAGAGADAQEIWKGTIARLPRHRYHVVQVAGFASWPARGNAVGGPIVQPIADEIARYIDEQRLHRPAVIGLSMGGTVAMVLAARYADRIDRVMVLDMVPFMGTFYGPPGRVTNASEAEPIAAEVRKRMLAETPDARLRNMQAMVAKMVRTEQLREPVLRHGIESDARVMANVMQEMISLDLRPELAKTSVPMRVLYVHAPLIPITAEQTDALYREMFSGVRGATLRRIEDAYHFIMLDQPEVFANEVRDFLS